MKKKTEKIPLVPYKTLPNEKEKTKVTMHGLTLHNGSTVIVGTKVGFKLDDGSAIYHDLQKTHPDLNVRSQLTFACSQDAIIALVELYSKLGLLKGLYMVDGKIVDDVFVKDKEKEP